MSIRAKVSSGRIIVDEPTLLPEGTTLNLVVDDEGTISTTASAKHSTPTCSPAGGAPRPAGFAPPASCSPNSAASTDEAPAGRHNARS
jgi:hypothetical protein